MPFPECRSTTYPSVFQVKLLVVPPVLHTSSDVQERIAKDDTCYGNTVKYGHYKKGLVTGTWPNHLEFFDKI